MIYALNQQKLLYSMHIFERSEQTSEQTSGVTHCQWTRTIKPVKINP